MARNQLNALEIRRKLFHVFLGIAILILLQAGFLTPLLMLAVIGIGMLISIAAKRFDIPMVSWFLERFERPEARKTFPGKAVISFFAGSLLAVKLFPSDIAYASIVVLTLGDSVSHLIGYHIGKIKNPLNGLKAIEGNLAGGLAGAVGALIFVEPLLAFTGAIGAMIVEAVQVKMNELIVDDNIIIPLAAGAIMLLLRVSL